MIKLEREFYEKNTVETAKNLVGKLLVRRNGDSIMSVRITEAEAYVGAVDKACHCFGGKITNRTKVMFGQPGHAYVYFIYGMYYCFNIVTEPEGCGSAVLIRCAEPVCGFDELSVNRYQMKYDSLNKYKIKNMLNGPGKLCMALNITKDDNGIDLTKDDLFVADDKFSEFSVKSDKRMNIDYAEEAKDFMWRFIMAKEK